MSTEVRPTDPAPRLVGLGMSAAAAHQLIDQHEPQHVVDALDALDEFGANQQVVDPVGWVEAAVTHRWDLTGVLAGRRDREARLAGLKGDLRRREAAGRNHPAWRERADQWAQALSGALDDRQLHRAVDLLTDEVPGVGRRSVPVVRAELIAWAVTVHGRGGDAPLEVALAEDLDRGPRPGPDPVWPLPDPPECVHVDDQPSLDDRILTAIEPDRGTSAVVEAAAPELGRHVELSR